jgi:hypothetical protein
MGIIDFIEGVLEDLNLMDPRTVDPFPPAITLDLDTSDASFNSCAGAAASDPKVSDLCGGLVDLTGNPAKPPYAGHNDTDMVFVGSMGKMYAMYAAFELRRRVEVQAKRMINHGLSTSTAGWETKVFDELKKAWQPVLTAAFPRLPSGFPQFSNIFVLSTSGDVSFTEATPPVTDAALDAIGEFGAPTGKYRDWLRLMMRWSNNGASSNVIIPLSYPYINGLLASAGFFDPATNNGLWLSADYASHDWIPGPGNKAGLPLTNRWAKAQGRTKSNITGTAQQVARFMTALAQGKLVDQASCTEMIGMMTEAVAFHSYIQQAFEGATPQRPFTSVKSKIGFGDDKFSSDCAIVQVDRGADPARTLRFVEVILGSPPSKMRAGLSQLAVAYYDCVAARHP